MKAYIVRYGAYGDVLHCSYLPQVLKDNGFTHVAFEYNTKGEAIMRNNPYIDEHILFEPASNPLVSKQPVSFLDKRMKNNAEERGAILINLQFSLENGYIAMEDMSEYYLSAGERRKMYGVRSYYEQTKYWVDRILAQEGIRLSYPKRLVAELYFTEEEQNIVEEIYRRQYKDKFVVICNLSGSSRQKYFYDVEPTMKEFLRRHKDAVCITVGDDDTRKHLDFTGDRIINRAGLFDGKRLYPFRQSLLMSKYADMVIGYESGLLIASTALGTPSIQLMTTCSIKNHGGGMPSDYSLQSPVACSPCHRGPYEFIGCPKIQVKDEKYPACIKFDRNEILDRMEEVYAISAKEMFDPTLSTL